MHLWVAVQAGAQAGLVRSDKMEEEIDKVSADLVGVAGSQSLRPVRMTAGVPGRAVRRTMRRATAPNRQFLRSFPSLLGTLCLWPGQTALRHGMHTCMHAFSPAVVPAGFARQRQRLRLRAPDRRRLSTTRTTTPCASEVIELRVRRITGTAAS